MSSPSWADDGLKKPLDHSSYDEWNSIRSTQLARDGKWLLYSISPGKGDSTLKVRELKSQREFVIARGSSARFTYDSRFMLCVVQPDSEALKAAQKAKKPAHEQPQPSLLILDLKTGKSRSMPRARSYSLPRKASGWVAITMSTSGAKVSAAAKMSEVKQEEQIAPAQQQPAEEPAAEQSANKQTTPKESAKKPAQKTPGETESKSEPGSKKTPTSKKKKSAGADLILMELATGMETTYPYVTSHRFSEDGKRLALTISVEEGQTSLKDGVTVIQLPDQHTEQIVTGAGHYRGLTFDESGQRLAFLTDRDTYTEKEPTYAIYCAKAPDAEPTALVTVKSEAIPKDWHIPDSSRLNFSQHGKSLFFTTAPKPQEPEKEADDDEKPVKVDIWHWQDPLLQPMQLRRAEMEKRRTFLAVAHLKDDKILQLASTEMPQVVTGDEGNSRFAIGISDLPYRKLISWDTGYQDAFLLDTLTGKADRILEKAPSAPSFSPKAKYLVWWDSQKRAWFGMSTDARKQINLSAKIPHAVHDELHDTPSPPRGYGLAGWTDNDKEVLIYDRFDIWAVNPQRPNQPRCITEGTGRKSSTRFRIQRLDREAPVSQAKNRSTCQRSTTKISRLATIATKCPVTRSPCN